MKVLVIGGGGREHAVCTALAKSPKVDKIWCAPGNGGIAAVAECVDIKATDIDGVVAFSKQLPKRIIDRVLTRKDRIARHALHIPEGLCSPHIAVRQLLLRDRSR